MSYQDERPTRCLEVTVRLFPAMVVIGALLIPSAALPAQPKPPTIHNVREAHITTGVVRSISESEIVITEANRRRT